MSKRKWLEKFLELPNGIPSHDTFGRVFALLDPQQLAGVLRQFVQAVTGSLQGEAVAIDGKTLARSGESTTGKEALHLVSAWATQHGVVLGQVATADHSNEITAIPVLLQLLDVRGAVVTIDAMGCQKAIAHQVRDQGADYVLAVKGNQKNLKEVVEFQLGQGHSRVARSYSAGPCSRKRRPFTPLDAVDFEAGHSVFEQPSVQTLACGLGKQRPGTLFDDFHRKLGAIALYGGLAPGRKGFRDHDLGTGIARDRKNRGDGSNSFVNRCQQTTGHRTSGSYSPGGDRRADLLAGIMETQETQFEFGTRPCLCRLLGSPQADCPPPDPGYIHP
jgi:hypothetical protein